MWSKKADSMFILDSFVCSQCFPPLCALPSLLCALLFLSPPSPFYSPLVVALATFCPHRHELDFLLACVISTIYRFSLHTFLWSYPVLTLNALPPSRFSILPFPWTLGLCRCPCAVGDGGGRVRREGVDARTPAPLALNATTDSRLESTHLLCLSFLYCHRCCYKFVCACRSHHQ